MRVYKTGHFNINVWSKTLTLDYDCFDNDIFDLTVINHQCIALFHLNSGWV